MGVTRQFPLDGKQVVLSEDLLEQILPIISPSVVDHAKLNAYLAKHGVKEKWLEDLPRKHGDYLEWGMDLVSYLNGKYSSYQEYSSYSNYSYDLALWVLFRSFLKDVDDNTELGQAIEKTGLVENLRALCAYLKDLSDRRSLYCRTISVDPSTTVDF